MANWIGSVLYKSSDNGASYVSVDQATNAGAVGTASGALASGTTDFWDDANSVQVVMSYGELASATDSAVLSGANAAALGAHGRWEILQYRTATLTAASTYTLSGFLRGRRGTEWAVGTHQAGDTFVVLSSATIHRLALDVGELNASRLYKAVTSGRSITSGTPQSFACANVGLKPYSPVYLQGVRDGSGNLTITWLRRSRIGRTFGPLPLAETSEFYDLDIYDGAGYTTVVRSFSSLTTASQTYTAAQQTTDFGSPQSTVYVRVYQISEIVGRGTPGDAAL